MSRLDRHVTVVRNKLAFQVLLNALAWMALGYLLVAWLVILVDKLMGVRIPAAWRVPQVAAGLVVVGAGIYALLRRPRADAAAVAIDEKLGLKEKFSTALSVRQSSDPFAKAVVLDAEQTAQNVRLEKQFPLQFPPGGYAAIAAGFAVFLTVLFLPAMDLFGHEAQIKKTQEQQQIAQNQAKDQVANALAAVEALPKTLAEGNSEFKLLQKDLQNLASQHNLQDPDGAKRKAVEALQQVKDALGEAAEREQKLVAEQNKEFNNKLGDMDANGPLAPVAEALKNGKIDQAITELDKTVEKFDDMKPEEQTKTIEEMSKMADKLAQMANDPKMQDKVADAMKDAGIPPQQAQDLAKQMQQAANGDKQAQANLANAAQQMQNNLNQQIQQAQKQAATGNQAAQTKLQQLQAQKQAMQSAMQSAQASASSQAQANAMSQAAGQMAKAMQAQSQARAQGQTPGQSGSQSQPGQGQKPGNSQAMAQAQQAMNSAMSQMQQARADQQMINAQQAAAAQAAQQAANACNGQGQQGQGQGQGQGQNKPGGNNGQWGQGNPNNQGAGMGGPGIGNAGVASKEFAPSSFKSEIDLSTENQEGKLLAGTMIKDHTPRGDSTAKLAQIGQSQLKESTDSIENDRITGPSRKAAEEYFRTMSSAQSSDGSSPAASPR